MFKIFVILLIVGQVALVNQDVDLNLRLFYEARERLHGVSVHTPLQYSASLSTKYQANVFLKREDLQVVRSFKVRGAYNMMSSTPRSQLNKGVVTASAGNHAQGVALSCSKLKVHCKIFMPVTAPAQKLKKVKEFGKSYVEIVQVGRAFDQASDAAVKYQKKTGALFVPAFNNLKIIIGQGTAALEILEDSKAPIDFVFAGIGGGGFLSGISAVFRHLSRDTKMIGVEPLGAPSMYASLRAGKVTRVSDIDPFVDGCAVGTPGDLTLSVMEQNLDDLLVVPEGKVCTTMLELYNDEGIVAEPSGALTVASLDMYRDQIKGKTVVAVISGGNFDINRTDEVRRRSLEYEEKQKELEMGRRD
jgi:threonine dehydratase